MIALHYCLLGIYLPTRRAGGWTIGRADCYSYSHLITIVTHSRECIRQATVEQYSGLKSDPSLR